MQTARLQAMKTGEAFLSPNRECNTTDARASTTLKPVLKGSYIMSHSKKDISS